MKTFNSKRYYKQCLKKRSERLSGFDYLNPDSFAGNCFFDLSNKNTNPTRITNFIKGAEVCIDRQWFVVQSHEGDFVSAYKSYKDGTILGKVTYRFHPHTEVKTLRV